jgi:hypothetical protein
VTKFAPPVKEVVKPDRICVVPPEVWAYNWKPRPTAEVAIGLRVISEREVQVGKSAASQYMLKMYGTDGHLPISDIEKASEAWNDAFLAYVVGRSACDPNDADKQYFTEAQDGASKAFTSQGLKRIWDEYTLAARGTGERYQIKEDELVTLARSLAGGALSGLEAEAQREVRKHLAWVYEMLAKAGELLPDDEEEGYVVRMAPESPPVAAPAS